MTQKYCSDECRVKYYSERYYGKVEVRKVCANCGNPFTTTSPMKQKYCSPECREDAKTKRIQGVLSGSKELKERYTSFKRDGFKCTVCGRGAADGVRLEVYEERTVCAECRAGMP